MSLLALDWKKAFDSVHTERLIEALARFGFSTKLQNVISGLMRERRFFVEDNGVQSDLRPQLSGISQGCTLSPLLFIVVMSVVMHDAVQMLPPESRQAYDKGDLADLVYADDTLLIGASSKHLQAFLVAVEKAGKYFGLELHDGKFQLLQIQTNERVRSTNGQDLSSSGSLLYLGSSLDTCFICILQQRNVVLGVT